MAARLICKHLSSLLVESRAFLMCDSRKLPRQSGPHHYRETLLVYYYLLPLLFLLTISFAPTSRKAPIHPRTGRIPGVLLENLSNTPLVCDTSLIMAANHTDIPPHLQLQVYLHSRLVDIAK
jgi:hypothetical protein